jgi:hypothetical protein
MEICAPMLKPSLLGKLNDNSISLIWVLAMTTFETIGLNQTGPGLWVSRESFPSVCLTPISPGLTMVQLERATAQRLIKNTFLFMV